MTMPWATPNTAPAPSVSTEPGRSSTQATTYSPRKTRGATGPRPRIHVSAAASQAPASRARASNSSATAAAISRISFMAWPPLRPIPDDRPRDQRGDDPEGEIDEHEVDGEHRSLVQPEIPGARRRQEKQKESRQRREDVEKADEVEVLPHRRDEEPEGDPPQPAPEERLVHIRCLKGEWRHDAEL